MRLTAARLTPRQHDVLLRVAGGMTYQSALAACLAIGWLVPGASPSAHFHHEAASWTA